MRCSVVFGVMLRLLVISFRRRLPLSTNSAAYYQRYVSQLAGSWSGGTVLIAPVVPVGGRSVDTMQAARYRLKIAISAYPTCTRRPVRGVLVGILPRRLVCKNYGVAIPEGEKNFEDMFIRFDRIHERDRHTDGRTDRHRMTA